MSEREDDERRSLMKEVAGRLLTQAVEIRDKRIAELEAENKRLRNQLSNVLSYIRSSRLMRHDQRHTDAIVAAAEQVLIESEDASDE